MIKFDYLEPESLDETFELLDQHGVLLASWRVGADVQDICVRLAESAMNGEGNEEQPQG